MRVCRGSLGGAQALSCAVMHEGDEAVLRAGTSAEGCAAKGCAQGPMQGRPRGRGQAPQPPDGARAPTPGALSQRRSVRVVRWLHRALPPPPPPSPSSSRVPSSSSLEASLALTCRLRGAGVGPRVCALRAALLHKLRPDLQAQGGSGAGHFHSSPPTSAGMWIGEKNTELFDPRACQHMPTRKGVTKWK